MHHGGQEDIDYLAGLGAGEAHSRHTHDLVDASACKVIDNAKVCPTTCGFCAKRRDQ
jgi:hypothetical protein